MKKKHSIPVNNFGGEFNLGISIEKLSFTDLPHLEAWNQPERHDRHSFFLLERGTVAIEIDFTRYDIKSPSIIYMHPDQVHRILAFKDVTVTSWAIDNENLNPEYLRLLEDLTPVKPLLLQQETYSMIADSTSQCIKFYQQKNNKLYPSLLRDSCNVLVALVVSQYAELAKSRDKLSRFEFVTKAFKEALELSYVTEKRPAAYAQKLNISTSYLNECVKNTTGYSVSHHIQQRIVLEAKRLLFHSDQSIKEIASTLGYDDYPYFSRLFTKVTGMTALAFRNKNHD